MEGFKIYRNLDELNSLPDREAEQIFRSASGSAQWAREMTLQRPFRMLGSLFETADRLWFSLPPPERVSAFAEAGEIRCGTESGELADVLRLYHHKFGFIFVSYNGGNEPAEIVAICRARLGNSAETELQIATEEHRKRIEHRLTAFLEK